MIVTVTLNPAIDLFLETPRIEWNSVLRATAVRRRAGGKGVNVSRMLAILGEPSIALVLAGGGTGSDLASLARAEGMEVAVVPSGLSVRINVVVEEVSAEPRHIKVNMPGEEVSAAALERVAAWLEAEAPRLRAVVLAGRLPPGLPRDSYAVLIRTARERTLAAHIDASGPELAEALREGPDLLKVNRVELEELMGRPLAGAPEIADALRTLRKDAGIACACATDGARGAVLADEAGIHRATPPAADPRRPVGAGDCFMAGLTSGRMAGLRGEALLRRALACGTGWATCEDGVVPSLARIRELEAEARVSQVS